MKFTETHEWIAMDTGVGTVGITDFAQRELGDIVYVELPKIGNVVKKGEEAAVLESTKAAADVYAPVSGKILAVNSKLVEAPDLINKSPQHDGWIFKLEVSQPEELNGLSDKEG